MTLMGRLETDVGAGQPLDRLLQHWFRQHPELGSRDRRFFGALAFSWFRWRGWLHPPAPPAYALAYALDALTPHPAATLLAAGRPAAPAGLLSLHDKAQVVGRWLASAPPPAADLVPAWVPASLAVPPGADSAAHVAACLAAFQERPPVWLRADRGAPADPDTLAARVGAPLAAHERLPGAFRAMAAAVDERRAAAAGCRIQDLASQCVGWMCDPKPGEDWWDVCAGAGGKSLHLADRMLGRGRVLATDIRPGILAALERRRSAVAVIQPRLWDGARDPEPNRLFDGTLVDAPCSGIGTWARNPDARWRTPAEKLPTWPHRQLDLLIAAAQKTRPGGRLVYAVCTLTAMETTGVMTAFLRRYSTFYPDPVAHPLTAEPTAGSVWIWPGAHACNGMFVARMRRRDSGT